ncbi:MAG: transcriptional regulatory protein [Rhizobacter sp.]|nr:transcriptional regulatory protein [Rhizobacter sp.]
MSKDDDGPQDAPLDETAGPFDPSSTSGINDLYGRPGFLLRRAQQIAVGLFIKECAEFDLTPPQHSILLVLKGYPGLDQSTLAEALGYDRATIGQMLERLETRGLAVRVGSVEDRRRKLLALTADGEALVDQASGAINNVSTRLLSPLSPSERELFVQLLRRVTDALNSESRTPVRPPEPR